MIVSKFHLFCLSVFLGIAMAGTAQEALPGEKEYLAGHLARSAGRLPEAATAFAAAAQAGGPLADFAQVRAHEARWMAGEAAAEGEAWQWYQSAPPGPARELCASRLGVRFAQTGRGEQAAEMLLPLVAIDPVPWWMDAVLWEAGEALTRAGGAGAHAGYACFLRIVERPGYAPQRNDAARRLRNSADPVHRRAAAIALFRAGGFGEAEEIITSTSLDLKDAAGAPIAIEALDALLLATPGDPGPQADAVTAVLNANLENPWFPLAVSRVVRKAHTAKNPEGAQRLALWLLEAYPGSREAGDSVWFCAQALAAKGDAGALALYEALAAKAKGYWRNTNAANEVVQYWLAKDDLNRAQAAAESLGHLFPESKFRAETYYKLAKAWEARGDHKKALQNLVFAVNSGPGDYFAHRALELLYERIKIRPADAVALRIDGVNAVLQPMPGLLAAPPALPAEVVNDPRVRTARFFGLHGMEEGEWAALGLVRGLGSGEADGPWYLALADAGLNFTAQQWADKHGWGLDGGTRTLARWRLEFPRPYREVYLEQARALGVDPYLLMAIARQESTFRASIKSRSGATGVMQLMPATAAWMAKTTPGVTPEIAAHLTSPVHSILLGANYIAQMLDKFGANMLYAAAAYNAGPGNVSKWLKATPGAAPDVFVDVIPFEETRGYVRKVLGNFAAYHSIYPPLQ